MWWDHLFRFLLWWFKEKHAIILASHTSQVYPHAFCGCKKWSKKTLRKAIKFARIRWRPWMGTRTLRIISFLRRSFFYREVIWCACIESKNIFAVFGFNRICTTELYFKRSFIVHDTEFFIISDCGSGLQLFLILFNDINEKRLIRACWAWLMLSSRSIRFYFEISETRLKVNHCSVTGKFRAITSRHWWLLA